MKYWLLLLLFPVSLWAQFDGPKKSATNDIKVSPFVEGTLLLPKKVENPPLAILIGGSGPVDRDGNQPMLRNNSLKLLAEGLQDKGIASFRYDKRIVARLRKGNLTEEDIRFDDFIKDAIDVIEYFKRSNAFSKLIVVGHSQGSLVGMIASQERADAFVSIAGAGQELDDVIVDQLAKQAPGLKENARQAFDDMRANGIAVQYSPGLASIFRASLQPFLISWMKFNPQEEISKLNIPILIINGDKDLQVQLSEADLLHKAKPGAQVLIIEGMNHIFRKVEGDDIDNTKTYNNASLPIMPELVEAIVDFINR